VVTTGDDARSIIGLLARDDALRAGVGGAAREAVIELLWRQRERARRFYFDDASE